MTAEMEDISAELAQDEQDCRGICRGCSFEENCGPDLTPEELYEGNT